MTITNNDNSLSENLAQKLSQIQYDDLPEKTREVITNEFIDTFGLIIASRQTEYVRQLMASCDHDGECTVLGQARPLDASGAAIVQGAAIHGEDFDDTLEGAPIRVAAMVIPGLVAAGERYGISGRNLILGAAVGLESICRLNRVAPGLMHKKCFHPVGIIGPFGAAAAISAALNLGPKVMATAFGVAGSMASGIIEYLGEGAWTKRLHPGWASHSGYRAVRLAQEGFIGPRYIFEGQHGLFKAFAGTSELDKSQLSSNIGKTWQIDDVVFKPYACGTMIHPYIDCMIRLAEEGCNHENIVEIECETGEGFVHRLWEPLKEKQTPSSAYAAKFSVPWCMAMAFFERNAGLSQFTETLVRDKKITDLSKKIRYVIDPDNEYPDNYTGHIKVTFSDGTVRELRQPHMRGGNKEPLSQDELIRKFHNNVSYGGWSKALGEKLLNYILNIPSQNDLKWLHMFRL